MKLDRELMSDRELLVQLDTKLDAVKEHLGKINGRLEKGENRMEGYDKTLVLIEERQKNLLFRVFGCLPTWIQVLVVAWLGESLIASGVAVYIGVEQLK